MIGKCTGCNYCQSGTLPTFETDEELEQFFDHHEPEQFPGYLRVRPKTGRPRKTETRETIHMAILPSLKAQIQGVAREKGIGYQTLMQLWLQERLDQERSKR